VRNVPPGFAHEEARRLEDEYVGPEHFLLALARGDSVAAEALRRCGVGYEQLVQAHLARRARYEEEFPREGKQPQFNPASYRLLGRMEGFAAAGGSSEVEPEHVLLALVWHAGGGSGYLLRRLGTSRADVQRALAGLGVAVPPLDPPPDDERPRGERVFIPVERLDDVLRAMRERIPPGDVLGFNYYAPDRTKAYVVAGPDFDLQGLVDEVLADT
jgi:ATP-dependent Clp protease ATP-binding subunit ClpA